MDQFPGLPIHRDSHVLMRDPSIDAVVIATPAATHFALVRDALSANKHVLCEKPLCLTVSEAEQLANLAESRKLLLLVGHVFLFNGGIAKIRQIVSSGELGQMRYLMAVRTNLGPVRHDVNAAYDLATHDIAVVNWLLESEPLTVSATGACFLQPGIEDVVSIALTYPSGVFVNIQASWLSPKKVRQITLVGSKRMMIWDDLELSHPLTIYNRGVDQVRTYDDYGEFLRVSTRDGDTYLPKIDIEEPLKTQDRYFLEAIGSDRAVRSDARFSIGVIRTLESVARALNEARTRLVDAPADNDSDRVAENRANLRIARSRGWPQ
jgi:predicted dehydrogenase